MSYTNYLSDQQKDAYNYFKKFAQRHGRLPNVNEIQDGLHLSTPGQALYWAGCILLKGGFGLRVANGDAASGVVTFGDFKFPMHGDPQKSASPAPVAAPVVAPVVAQAMVEASLAPAAESVAAADAPDDMPKNIRNLVKAVQNKGKYIPHTHVVRNDVMTVMDQLKKFNVTDKISASLLHTAMVEAGKRHTRMQVVYAVRTLLEENKLNGQSNSFTYF